MVSVMSREIDTMFSEIHKDYDRMNTIMSMGFDRRWRDEAAKESMINREGFRLLDVACGTGELAIRIEEIGRHLGKSIDIIGMDFNRDMLRIANGKLADGISGVSFERGDAIRMRYRSSSFDVVTSGFALRDFDSTERFAKESYRVLRRGGKIVLLDMSKPNSAVSDLFFKAYFGIMRLEGLFVNNDAYNFLVNSIKSFDIERFRGELEDAGFRRVRVRRLTFGVAFLITGYK